MQVHGPSEITSRIQATLNPGVDGSPPFGVFKVGSVEVLPDTLNEARLLHRATGELVRLMEDAGLS